MTALARASVSETDSRRLIWNMCCRDGPQMSFSDRSFVWFGCPDVRGFWQKIKWSSQYRSKYIISRWMVTVHDWICVSHQIRGPGCTWTPLSGYTWILQQFGLERESAVWRGLPRLRTILDKGCWLERICSVYFPFIWQPAWFWVNQHRLHNGKGFDLFYEEARI